MEAVPTPDMMIEDVPENALPPREPGEPLLRWARCRAPIRRVQLARLLTPPSAPVRNSPIRRAYSLSVAAVGIARELFSLARSRMRTEAARRADRPMPSSTCSVTVTLERRAPEHVGHELVRQLQLGAVHPSQHITNQRDRRASS